MTTPITSAQKCPFCVASEASARNTCVCPMCHEEENVRIKAADKSYLRKKSVETTHRRIGHLYAATSNPESVIPWPHLSSTKLPPIPASSGMSPGRSTHAATPFSQLRDLEQRDLSELMYPDGSYIMVHGQLRRVNRSPANSAPLPSLTNGLTSTPDSEIYAHRSKPEPKNFSPVSRKRGVNEDRERTKHRKKYVESDDAIHAKHKRRGHERKRHTHRRIPDSSYNSDSSTEANSTFSDSWSDSFYDSSSGSSDSDAEDRPCRHCLRAKKYRRARAQHKKATKVSATSEQMHGASGSSSDCRCSCHNVEQSGRRTRGNRHKDKSSKSRRADDERQHTRKSDARTDRPRRPSPTSPRVAPLPHSAPPRSSNNSNGGSPSQQPPLREKETPLSFPQTDNVSSNRDAPTGGYFDPITGIYYYYYSPGGYHPSGSNGAFPGAVGLPPLNNGNVTPTGAPPQFGPYFSAPDFTPAGGAFSGHAPMGQAQHQQFVPIGANGFPQAGDIKDGSGRKHRAVPHAAYIVLMGSDGVPIAVPTSDDVGQLLRGKRSKNVADRGDELTPFSPTNEGASGNREGRKQRAAKPHKATQHSDNLRRPSNEELLSQLEQLDADGKNGDPLVQRVMNELRQRLFGEGNSTGAKQQAVTARQSLRDRLNKAVGTSDEFEAQYRAEEEEAKRRAADAQAQARREEALEEERRKRAEKEEAERLRIAHEAREQQEEAERQRQKIEQENKKAEAERTAREEAERQRLQKEKEEEEARLKAEAERAAREEAEKQRLQKEKEEEEARLKAEAKRAAREEAEKRRLRKEKEKEAARLAQEEADRQRCLREQEEARLALEASEREERDQLRRLKEEEDRRAREAVARAEAERKRVEQEWLEQQHREEENHKLLRQLIQQEAQQRDDLENDEERDLVFILENQQVEMDELLEAEEDELRHQAMQSLMTDEMASRASIGYEMRKSIVAILESFDVELEEISERERKRSEASASEEAARLRRKKAKQDADISRSRLIPNQLKAQMEDGRIQYVGDPYISIIEERMRERRREEKRRQSKLQEQLERQAARQSTSPFQHTPRDRSSKGSMSSPSPNLPAARSPSTAGVVPVLRLKQVSASQFGGLVGQSRSQSNAGNNKNDFSSAAQRYPRAPSSRGSLAPAAKSRFDSVSHAEKPGDLDFVIQGHNIAEPSKTRSRASSIASNRGVDVQAGGRVFSTVNTPRSQREFVAPQEASASANETPREVYHFP